MTPLQREGVKIPNWNFAIREQPQPGDYRFLRLAWKKRGEGSVMIELAAKVPNLVYLDINVPFATGFGTGYYTPGAFLFAAVILTIFSIAVCKAAASGAINGSRFLIRCSAARRAERGPSPGSLARSWMRPRKPGYARGCSRLALLAPSPRLVLSRRDGSREISESVIESFRGSAGHVVNDADVDTKYQTLCDAVVLDGIASI